MACLYVNCKNIPPFVGIIPNKQSNSTMHCLQEAHFMYTDMSKVIRQKKKCHIILVSQGCHGKVPQSGWLNNTILLSQTLKSGCLRSRCSGTVYSHMLGGKKLCQAFSWWLASYKTFIFLLSSCLSKFPLLLSTSFTISQVLP